MTLDPGMAFGSGTHHTTRLCCELLEQLPVEHTRILDMGTGSGILSIAALMLGAQEAVGVDIDKVAVRTAAENAEVNGFGPDRFTAVTADLIHQPLEEELTRGGFDIVLANIVADVIIALAPAIYHHLKSGGHLVASGIILPRKEEVIAALETEGMVITQEKEQDGWCALLMQKA
jgi:ribosomal protein L11 methyltransferase (prmA)